MFANTLKNFLKQQYKETVCMSPIFLELPLGEFHFYIFHKSTATKGLSIPYGMSTYTQTHTYKEPFAHNGKQNK